MYGANETSAAAGAALAVTGLTAGTWVLAAAGLVFIAVGLWALVRSNGKNRP